MIKKIKDSFVFHAIADSSCPVIALLDDAGNEFEKDDDSYVEDVKNWKKAVDSKSNETIVMRYSFKIDDVVLKPVFEICVSLIHFLALRISMFNKPLCIVEIVH